MDEVVEGVLRAYGSTDTASRERIADYLLKLKSAGRADAQLLTECGLAYLRELHEGPDRRYTGC